ncbi:MAG: ATPase [Bacteroidetes bacterium 4484_249]|nr:MAG: ATPase [Bacteroidetes bacterium 4484_249]
MNKYSVIVENISKSYGDIKALDNISLQIGKGELFGLIGPDGAGKTSLFRILTSLLIPDSGNATVEGYDVVNDFKKLRRILGYMPGRFSLYLDLTVEENLNFFATIFGTTLKENYNLIKDIYIQIEPFKHRKAGNLSGGMKQKLALSCALIHKPDVLFLDEPTTGVDAVSRKEFWEMLKNLQQKGITIMVSTPYMDEAGMCDKVALIQKASILSIDSPANIVSQYQYPLFNIKSTDMYELPRNLMKFPKAQSAYRFGDAIHFAVSEEIDSNELNSFLQHAGHKETEISKISPGIEDCFMALMTNET